MRGIRMDAGSLVSPEGTEGYSAVGEGNLLNEWREFTTVETFPITGRGLIHIIQTDSPPALGELVILDGEVHKVTGVEWPMRNGCMGILIEIV